MYIINLRKSDKSIRLVNNSKNIILRQSNKNITLQQTGRPGPKGDKGDPGTGTNDYNDLINKPFIPDELSELADDTDHRTVTDTEKSTWNAKQEALTADVDYLTPTTASSTYEPLLPATPVDPTYKFLNGNKQWTPISVGGSGYAGDLYFTTAVSDVVGYLDLSYIPEPTETILSGIVQNNEVLFRTYLYPDPLETTIIDSGTWKFAPWLRVSNANGVTQVKSEPFIRHIDGSETTLFSTYSDEINNTGFIRLEHESPQLSFNVLPTDRLGIRIYGKTTSGAAITIYSIVGDGRSSYFTTPLRIRHNQLRDFNQDPEVQHMTSSEKTAVGTIDGKMNIDQTIPQTMSGIFTFPQVATPIIKPTADSTTSIGIFKADGITNIANIDTTNSRIGIGTTSPTAATHINSGAFDHQLVLSGSANIVGETAGIEFKYNGSGVGAIARIIAVTQSGGGGDIQFQTAANGASAYVAKVTINRAGVLLPFQATTASAPTYVKGGLYFDTTLNKLRVGGATGWETITSS